MPSSRRRRKAARCSYPDCKKQVQTRRLCKAHGGGIRCRGSGCTKLAQSRGLCVAHGGGRRCAFDGCDKLAQYKGLCLSHGGGRRCCVEGCEKFVQLRGCCKAHLKQLESPKATTYRLVHYDSSQSLYPVQATTLSKLDIEFLMNPSIRSSEAFPTTSGLEYTYSADLNGPIFSIP